MEKVGAPFNRCIECEDVITTPICAECLAERMQVVIQEYDSELAKQIKGMHIDGDTKCIFCGQGMALCAHCFSREIYEFINQKNKVLAEEFVSRFDFDLRRALC